MNMNIRILLILGSVREGRKSDRIAHYLMQLLNEMPGVEPELLDLIADPLPMFETRWQTDNPEHTQLLRVSNILKAADGIVLISPEYHGSYTGVLKNALDHFWKEFQRKPMGVVTTGSGKFGGINASTEMQQLILSLGGYPIPNKLLVPHVNDAFDENQQPVSPELVKGSAKFLEEYLWFVRALTYARLETESAR